MMKKEALQLLLISSIIVLSQAQGWYYKITKKMQIPLGDKPNVEMPLCLVMLFSKLFNPIQIFAQATLSNFATLNNCFVTAFRL